MSSISAPIDVVGRNDDQNNSVHRECTQASSIFAQAPARSVGSRRESRRGQEYAQNRNFCSGGQGDTSTACFSESSQPDKEQRQTFPCMEDGFNSEQFKLLRVEETAGTMDQFAINCDLDIPHNGELFEPMRLIIGERFPWPAPKLFSDR